MHDLPLDKRVRDKPLGVPGGEVYEDATRTLAPKNTSLRLATLTRLATRAQSDHIFGTGPEHYAFGGDAVAMYVWSQKSGERHPFRDSLAYSIAKRLFDVGLAATLLPVLLPVGLLLMCLIKCTSKGPVFYRHLRVGQDCRSFYLYKFRTMLLHGDTILRDYLCRAPEAQQEWDRHYKLRSDPRVTRVGAFLRRTSLDELPQLVNVLLGSMSFVGPRPIVREEIQRYGEAFPFYAAVKPGITGLWQVSGRGTVSYENRVLLDVRYAATWSFFGDVRLLLRTPRAVCSLRGAY